MKDLLYRTLGNPHGKSVLLSLLAQACWQRRANPDAAAACLQPAKHRVDMRACIGLPEAQLTNESKNS